MFTGIIEDLGEVKKIINTKLSIATKLADTKTADSIAINGVCLTVRGLVMGNGYWVLDFDISLETLKCSDLGELRPGEKVNLERALKTGERLGGHLVTGHIEGVGKIVSIKPGNRTKIFEFSAPWEMSKYLVPKGSIAVDGVSLTVVAVNPLPITHYRLPSFTVSVVPYTLENTTLGFKKVGATVNLEPDILAKYIENFIEIKKTKPASQRGEKEITLDFLKKAGFF